MSSKKGGAIFCLFLIYSIVSPGFISLCSFGVKSYGVEPLTTVFGGEVSHNADAMWVEPSETSFANVNIGFRFNITIWLNMTEDVFVYQIALHYNRSQLKCVCVFPTAPPSSQFMSTAPSGTTFFKVIDTSFLGNGSVLAMETCLAPDVISGPHCDSLMWLEFEVIAEPSFTGKFDLTTETTNPPENGNNWVGGLSNDSDVIYYPIVAYDGYYEFLPCPPAKTADLSVSSPDISFSDSNPSEGQTITISVQVHNIGQTNLQDVDVQFSDGNATIGETQISFISHNSQGTATIEWTAEHEGFHLIKVVVDPNDVTNDVNRENNQATRSVLVGEFPYFGGIVINGIVTPNTTSNGLSVLVQGYAEYNTTYGAGEPVAGAEVTIAITGWRQESTHTMSNGTYRANITAPYSPGNYAISVTVTDYTFWENIELALNVTQPEGVDLTLTHNDISLSPPSPLENEMVNITAIIHNIGTEIASNASVGFYDGDTSFCNVTIDVIRGGGSEDLVVSWSLAPFGWHRIRVVIDPENRTVELCKNNNEAYKDVYVYPQFPDLTPTSIDFSENTPLVSRMVAISVNVQNIGGTEATDVYVSFYDDGLSIGNTTIPIIPGKGQSRIASIGYVFTTVGWHNVSVVIDIENRIPGEPDDNNCYWRLVYVHLPLPDLTLSSWDITFSNGTPTIGDEITISATIHNIGETDAYDVTVCFYDGYSEIHFTTIPVIPAGGQEVVSTSWNATPSGWHRIEVEVDENNTIEESNESNNAASRYINVSPKTAADVCVYSKNIVFSNTNPAPNEHVTIYATILNIGNAEAQEVTVWFYVDDIQLGSPKTISSIAIGENATLTTTWIASGIGSHIAKAVADTQAESNKNNNNATAAIIVGEHDIAIISLTIGKTVVGEGYCMNYTLTFRNNGAFPETFDVNVSANLAIIAALPHTALENGTTSAFTGTWNTSGYTKGNYTISAHAEHVPSETNIADNSFTDGWIIVSIVGDITGNMTIPWPGLPDGKVDGKDLGWVAWCFGSYPGAPPPLTWDPNCDINNDGQVDGKDLGIVAWHFGEYAQ